MMKRYLLPLFSVLLVISCKEEKVDPEPVPAAVITPWEELNAGDEGVLSHAGRTGTSALTLVGGSYVCTTRDMTDMEMPVYPRFIKTKDGRWLVFYHDGVYNTSTQKNSWPGNYCSYAESTDLKNWTYAGKIFPKQTDALSEIDGRTITRLFAGPHPLRLPDGRIMVVASYRGSYDMRHRTRDNGLAIRYSSDEGRTWSSPEDRICVGTNWEPRPIVLSSGRIIIYYTDSRPYVEGIWSEALVSSGVSYIYSDDNGATWKPDDPHETHLPAFRQKRDFKNGVTLYTDQMPGVIELLGSRQLVGTGESNMAIGNASTSDYWVSLARSDKNGDWGMAEPHPSGELPAGRQDWEKKFTKGAGPQIEQFRSGETVLTYNDNNIVYYRLGDETATVFGEQTREFEGASPKGRGFWSSAYPDGHSLVVGFGGTGGKTGLGYYLQIGRFYLNHDIRAVERSVKVDGNNAEWAKTDHALFVGSAGNMHATLRASVSGGVLYCLAEMDASGALPDDNVTVYFSDPSKEQLSEGDFYIRVSPDGTCRCCRYSPGWWNVSSSSASAAAKGDGCWLAEFSVPLSELPVKDGEVRVNFAVGDSVDGLQSTRNLSSLDTFNWMKIIL